LFIVKSHLVTWRGLSTAPWLAGAIKRRKFRKMFHALDVEDAGVVNLAEVGPAGYCSPRHRVPFNLSDEGVKCDD